MAVARPWSHVGGWVRGGKPRQCEGAVSRHNTVSRDRSVLHYAVTDAGPGVPAGFRERVFEKFFRVEHHRRVDATERKGMGISLSVCTYIRTAHGGPLWCDAGAYGVGTRLAFTLSGAGGRRLPRGCTSYPAPLGAASRRLLSQTQEEAVWNLREAGVPSRGTGHHSRRARPPGVHATSQVGRYRGQQGSQRTVGRC